MKRKFDQLVDKVLNENKQQIKTIPFEKAIKLADKLTDEGWVDNEWEQVCYLLEHPDEMSFEEAVKYIRKTNNQYKQIDQAYKDAGKNWGYGTSTLPDLEELLKDAVDEHFPELKDKLKAVTAK